MERSLAFLVCVQRSSPAVTRLIPCALLRLLPDDVHGSFQQRVAPGEAYRWRLPRLGGEPHGLAGRSRPLGGDPTKARPEFATSVEAEQSASLHTGQPET